MSSFEAEFAGRAQAIRANGVARAPATLGEVWQTEWEAAGLDTTFGVGKPMTDAIEELRTRLQDVAGKPVDELARERGMAFNPLSNNASTAAALGRIVDTLPDAQQKWLADYKDVWDRAKQKAAETERKSQDVAEATYGLGAHATAFASGVARQMVDPVNLALAPIGGPAKGPVLKWLGKEFAIGAATQAVQEPYISLRREELGLKSDSLMNIFEAGVGQAGFAGLLRGASAAWKAGRAAWRGPEVDITPADLDAMAHVAERDAVFERMGERTRGPEAMQAAERALNTGEPITGLGASRASTLDLEGVQPIIRPDGSRLEARYAVVERGQLITSHGVDGTVNPAFPPELQPRDRAQGTSHLQVTDIAGKLQPERLGPSPIAQEGAPIVGSDGLVESGNGRVLALEVAYARHPEKARAYRDYLESLGFENVQDMQQPVLVRIRQQDLAPGERAAFAAESNVATTGALSASERAFVDAKGLHEGIMELWQGGQASDAKNAPFVRRFAAELLAPQEQKAFVDAEGRLAAQGQDRIEAAIVARAYADKGIVRELTEATDQRSKTLLGAFADAAPLVARLKSAVADGRVSADLDVATPLIEAFNMVDRARRTGTKLGEQLDQIDMIKGAVKPEVRAAVELFFRNDTLTLPASRDTVAARISSAADQALMHQAGGFFGDELTAEGALRAAKFSTESLSSMDLAKRMSDAAQKDLPPGVAIESRGPNGPVLVGLENDWPRAVSVLQALRTGDAVNVLHHPDVGNIDVVWGDEKSGLAKIVKRHKEVLADLPERMARMQKIEQHGTTVVLATPDGIERAIITLHKLGHDKTWLLTAYDRNARSRPESGLGEGASVKRLDPSSPALSAEGSIARDSIADKADPSEARIAAMLDGMDPKHEFEFERPDGTMGKATAEAHLSEIRAERKAATELNDCIDRTGGRIETKD